jgi:hypothetical protein
MFHVEIRSSQTWALCAALLRILLLVGRCGDNSELVRDSTKPSDLLMESQNLRTRWVLRVKKYGKYGWKYILYVFKKKIKLQYIITCSVADPGCLSGTRILIFFHSGPRIQDPTTTIIGVKK